MTSREGTVRRVVRNLEPAQARSRMKSETASRKSDRPSQTRDGIARSSMLELRDQPEEMKRGGAKTMAEIADRFHRSLDNIDRVTDALLECGTGKEFIERVRTA